MLISSTRLREILEVSEGFGGTAGTILTQLQQQAHAQRQTLPPSYFSEVSMAASLTIIAAASIRILEIMENKDGKETGSGATQETKGGLIQTG